VAPPEAETRLDLLRSKAGKQASPLAEEVLAFLAENLRGNVRELEGALNSLHHYSRVAGRKIDVPLARQVLGDLLRHSVRLVKVDDVERAVCNVLRLANTALQSKQRGWSHSHPRMLAMFLARKHTGVPYSEIGQRFGSRNHSTAVAAEKKVRQWLKDDATLSLGDRPLRVRDVIERIERELLR
jgi:chromosomal replication initiator protein